MGREKPIPNLDVIIEEEINSSLSEVNTAFPAKILSYDAAKQSVEVKPQVKFPYEDDEGEIAYLEVPAISNVPVVFPGAGDFTLTFPLNVGDNVLLVISQYSIDDWLSDGKLHNQAAYTKFDMTDAIAIPGLRPFNNPRSRAHTDALHVGSDSGDGYLKVTDSEVLAGGDGAESLATKAELEQLRSDVNTWAASHIHTSAAPGVPTSPTTIPFVSAPATGTQVLKGK